MQKFAALNRVQLPNDKQPSAFPTFVYRLYLFWFAVGLVLVGLDLIPPWLEWANSMFLILSGALAVMYAMAVFGRTRGIVLSLLIFFTTFSIEGLSAYFNVFFGSYDYTDLFPPLLLGVPIGIGFAWITMVMSGHALTVGIQSPFVRSFVAAAYVMILDLVLDPVAYIVKSYWIWDEQSAYYDIPLSNFIGWFVIAFCWQFILLQLSNKRMPVMEGRLRVVFWTILALFIWLALLDGLWLAIAVSLGCLLVLQGARRWLV